MGNQNQTSYEPNAVTIDGVTESTTVLSSLTAVRNAPQECRVARLGI
jgi:hypothetical protein